MMTVTLLRHLLEGEIDEIADEAIAHRRTVERRLLRLPVRGRVAERIDAVLARRGIVAADSTDGGPRAARPAPTRTTA